VDGGPQDRSALCRALQLRGAVHQGPHHSVGIHRAAHHDRSGPALRHILRREFEVFGKQEYGERRKPGFLRVDTVYQGQKDGTPGVYYINSVDTVTQWQNVGWVQTISEAVHNSRIGGLSASVPLPDHWLHCDNGSEFLNYQDAKMLNKLLIEFTKSRAYRTTDNALVEGKSGAVLRKHRLRVHCRRTCRIALALLHRPIQPLPELSSTLRLCGPAQRHARPHQTTLSGRPLSDTIRRYRRGETNATGEAWHSWRVRLYL
jgi:hypothetical protein